MNSVWCIFTAAWGTPSADENGDALRAANDDNPPLAIMDGAADEEAVEAHEEAVEADVYEVQDGDSSITTTELEDTPPPKSSLEHEDGCGTVLQGGGTRGDTVTGETPDPQAKPVDVEFIEDSQATVYEYPDVEDSQDPFDSSLIQGSCDNEDPQAPLEVLNGDGTHHEATPVDSAGAATVSSLSSMPPPAPLSPSKLKRKEEIRSRLAELRWGPQKQTLDSRTGHSGGNSSAIPWSKHVGIHHPPPQTVSSPWGVPEMAKDLF